MSTVHKSSAPPALTPEEEARIVAEREALVAECLENLRSVPTRPDVDERGALRPVAEDEWNARMERFRDWIEESKMLPDDDPAGAHEKALRGIDETRQRSGMRTLFDGRLDS